MVDKKDKKTFSLQLIHFQNSKKVLTIEVKWFYTISRVKQKIEAELGYPASNILIFSNKNPRALKNDLCLSDLGINTNGHSLHFSFQFSSTDQFVIEPVENFKFDSESNKMLNEVKIALNSSTKPQIPGKTDQFDCTGGVYFMKDINGRKIAVFKPHDEEQGMPNNSKGYETNGLRENFTPGEGYLHEACAYLFDIDNFSSVPCTMLCYCEHPIFNYPDLKRRNVNLKTKSYPKLGSLQKFINANEVYEDISPSQISAFEIQKIALFDLRCLNHDRNSTNILCIRKDPQNSKNFSRSRAPSITTYDETAELDLSELLEDSSPYFSRNSSNDFYELVPIDHGYCFPTKVLINDYDWEWLNTNQIEQNVDPAIFSYFKSLDIESILSDLSNQGLILPKDSIFLLRVVHFLIDKSLDAGLNLKEIASLICRFKDDVPSPFENLVNDSEHNAKRTLLMRLTTNKIASPNSFRDFSSSKSSDSNISPLKTTLSSKDLSLSSSDYSKSDSDSVNSQKNASPSSSLTSSSSSPSSSVLHSPTTNPTLHQSSNDSNYDYFCDENIEPNLDMAKSLQGKSLTRLTTIDNSKFYTSSFNNFNVDCESSNCEESLDNVETPSGTFSFGRKEDEDIGLPLSPNPITLPKKDFNLNINNFGPYFNQGISTFSNSSSSYSPYKNGSFTTESNSVTSDSNILTSSTLTSEDEIKGERKNSFTDQISDLRDFFSLQSSKNKKMMLKRPGGIQRNVSFGAFESPAMYEKRNSLDSRQLGSLKKEQREKLFENSTEFQDLRLSLAFEAVENVLKKRKRSKSEVF